MAQERELPHVHRCVPCVSMCWQWQPLSLAVDSLTAALLFGFCYGLHCALAYVKSSDLTPATTHCCAALPALPTPPHPGLPEEVLITHTALARFYAVVAISSRDRAHRRCWAVPLQPETHSVDTLSVGGHAPQQTAQAFAFPLCVSQQPTQQSPHPLLVCWDLPKWKCRLLC